MKVLHLVCNSHLDPVWQWDWDEGASAALSTFYAACDLLDQYDYVFCHNEVLLYQYIEKFDPELFERIKGLVKQGKWKIMGGWYIQPDCLVPSGESLIRQCSLGREYFSNQFNARPTTALNFDSFGHTRGLPQILKKCGYDSYIFCRPMPNHHLHQKEDLPLGPFLWKGYDGSTIKALRYQDKTIYCSEKGMARHDIERKMGEYKDFDVAVALWGVGNHGGLSSAKDIEDIAVLQNEKSGEYKIIHSTLEDYFASVEPTKTVDQQFIAFMKSYSSCHAIKLAHDQLENALYLTEKVCSIADLAGKYSYDKGTLKEAEELLCQIEFHDVLSGTAIKTGTDSSIFKAYHAIDLLKGELFKAFAAMAKDLKKVTPNDDNIVVFNPYPYPFDGYLETEIYIEKGRDWSFEEHYDFRLYDENNDCIEYQVVQAESNVNVDRRKRFLIHLKMEPTSIKSIGIHKSLTKNRTCIVNDDQDIVLNDKEKTVIIDRRTGLLKSFIVEGQDYLSGGAFLPVMFNDNEDPWGWNINSFNDQYGQDTYPLNTHKKHLWDFKLDNSGKGVYEGITGVHVIENGDLLTEVESVFTKNESHVIVNYKIYRDVPYIDVNVRTIWNEPRKGLKIKLPVSGRSSYFAQMAYGVEKYSNNGLEYPCNRYVGNVKGDKALVIYNNSGIHSVNKKGKNIYLTLLNGAMYCAHPLAKGTSVVPDRTRYLSYIETGTHEFHFRVGINRLEECEKLSQQFNEKIYAVSFFPHGDGTKVTKNIIELSNQNVVITALKRRENGQFIIRLYNGTDKQTKTLLRIKGCEKDIVFGKFEFKTFVFNGTSIVESEDSSIY